ncbi:MAG: hypothetical protein GXX91_11450 [Verrucomicrobiaceae bacterium]|nr:hypothetical protein [Verrucomicrobiaceae bacterium]
MVYSNFDARIKSPCRIPEDRLKLVRELERQVKEARELRRLARLAGFIGRSS